MNKNDKPKPIYVDRLPPCNAACPLGNNIQSWLTLTKENKFQQAWQALMENNPFPATMGRVCYHPCENACNRRGFDAPININAVERFLGDIAIKEGWTIASGKNTGKKVLIIGAGPAGLSAAFQLRVVGHDVTIYEASKIAGGMAHYGIPSYRLPRNILDAETKRIENMGVKIEYNHKVEDVIAVRDKGGFDAVFIAIGSPKGRMLDIPTTGGGCKVIESLDFLAAIEAGKIPQIKDKKVIVYGGGNTAIDAARSAIRLEAKKVEIIYRRNREKMPAHDFEVIEAAEEGVTLRLLRTIEKINSHGITLNIMELNQEGWPEATGEQETINADLIILALGLNVDTEFLQEVDGLEFNKDGTINVSENMMTGCNGIFAGGDVVPYDRSVTTAIGHGKKAARNINAFLNNQTYTKPPKHELATQDKLHTDFYTKADRKNRSHINLTTRKTTFNEVVQSLNEADTIHEAKRCFSCGNCFECDTCYNVCPVKAITKLEKRYKIDDDKCIRCGLCARKCPCGAIRMESPNPL